MPRRNIGAAEPRVTHPLGPTVTAQRRKGGAAVALAVLALTGGVAGGATATAANGSATVSVGRLAINLAAHDGFKLDTCTSGDSTSGSSNNENTSINNDNATTASLNNESTPPVLLIAGDVGNISPVSSETPLVDLGSEDFKNPFISETESAVKYSSILDWRELGEYDANDLVNPFAQPPIRNEILSPNDVEMEFLDPISSFYKQEILEWEMQAHFPRTIKYPPTQESPKDPPVKETSESSEDIPWQPVGAGSSIVYIFPRTPPFNSSSDSEDDSY